MKLLVCIVAIVLAWRGVFLVWRMVVNWCALQSIQKMYTKKTYGKVVGIETKKDEKGRRMTRPAIEYKLEKEGETYRHGICSGILMEGSRFTSYSPRNIHVGDKVTIWYTTDDPDSMFTQRRMQQTRLCFTMLIPGCFYIVAAIMGMFYVINGWLICINS